MARIFRDLGDVDEKVTKAFKGMSTSNAAKKTVALGSFRNSLVVFGSETITAQEYDDFMEAARSEGCVDADGNVDLEKITALILAPIQWPKEEEVKEEK